jgi:hypothetical protein
MKRLLVLLFVVLGCLCFSQTSEAQLLFPRARLGINNFALGVNNLSLRVRNNQLRNELAFRNGLAFRRGFRDNLAFSRSVRLRGLGLSDEIRFQNRLRNDLDRRDFLRRQALRRQALRNRSLRLGLGADCF